MIELLEGDVVASLAPCPLCGTKPIDAYQKRGRFGKEYFIVFGEPGCMQCFGKTGLCIAFPMTDTENIACEKFRWVGSDQQQNNKLTERGKQNDF